MTLPIPPSPRRLAYLGTPAMAVPPLRALVDAGYEVVLVVSAPDRRRGRGSSLMPSPVKAAALELGLPVTDDPDALLDVDADLGVVVAYGRVLGSHLLDRLPMVNLHVSLLPRWRGAAPIQRAVLAGDERTGVCLMAVEEGLDTGGVYARAETEIDRKTVAELEAELVERGTELLLRALAEGFGEPTPQEGEPTYAKKVQPEELQIDWAASSVAIDRLVRVGGAWTTVEGSRLKLHAVEPVEPVQPADGDGGQPDTSVPGTLDGTVVTCGHGAVRLVEVQPEGGRRMAATAWRNGAGATVERLGT